MGWWRGSVSVIYMSTTHCDIDQWDGGEGQYLLSMSTTQCDIDQWDGGEGQYLLSICPPHTVI